MKTKITLLLATLLCLFYACREKEHISFLLHEVDELTNTHPDSALTMLNGIASEISSCPVSQRMHYELLRAKAQNKAYVDFTTDSIMLEVTDYYDHNGTANERMMAHYLLGCCYRDMEEAPRTLECYRDALTLADTLSKDCDFRTMTSICGQMAELYDKQVMPLEELEILKQFGINAQKCGDSLQSILAAELQLRAYDYLNDTAKIYTITKDVQRRYLAIGNVERSAQALPIAISHRLINNQPEEAKILMDEFERLSGLFDKEGFIVKERSHYYYSKALYYQEISKLDSAEYFYKLLLENGFKKDASKGLLKLFAIYGKVDSVSKYLDIYEEAENKFITDINFQSVRQTEAMYDYSRNQRIAMEKEIKLVHLHLFTVIIVFLFSFIFAITVLYFYHQKKKKQRKIEELANEYLTAKLQYEKCKKDLSDLQEHFSFEEQKKKELEDLKVYCSTLEHQIQSMNPNEKKIALHSAPIVCQIKEMTKPKHIIVRPTKEQWKELAEAVNQVYPQTYQTIIYSTLTETEQKIALLTRLELPVSDIALLLDTTPQSISNSKRKANKKLFNTDDSKSFSNHLLAIQVS